MEENMARAWIVALFVLCGIGAAAQVNTLKIGPGDQLSIQVLEAPELAQHGRVTDAGYFPLIIGGEVKLEGLTPAEAGAAVEKALKNGDYLLDPHVNVTVDQYVTQSVTVMGEVRNPGAFATQTPRSILDVLALAGGVTNLADRRITIERRGTNQKVSYFLSNHSSTALDSSVRVFPGDTVMVPKVGLIYVLGDVRQPGGYPIVTNNGKLTLLEAIALAGSHGPSAVPSHTRLIRKESDGTYVEMQLQLSKMEKGKRPDVELEPDDIVYVPFSYLRNMGASLGGLVAATTSAAIYRY